MTSYDYIIVGAGPTGLTLASLLPKNKKKLIIDKNSTIGGCHRVTRIEFNGKSIVTEHGPRVYSEAYVNTKKLLKKIGLPFNFVKYNHQLTSLIGIGEIPLSTVEYVKLLFSFSTYTAEAIENFTPKSKEFIKRLCLLTDGAGPERYPLRKLKNIVNQQAFYSLLQPMNPMDINLFNQWQELLTTNHNCTFLLNSTAKSPKNGTIIVDGVKYTASTSILLATVPWIFPELFSDTIPWNQFKYQNYISVMLWYSDKKKILKDWGFPKSEWGIAYVEISDYWGSQGSHLSTCITLLDIPSKKTGLTALESSESAIISEIIRQLRIPEPSFSHIYKHDDSGWISDVKIGPQTNDPSVFSIGTHNQMSKYDFTSFESAVSNAISFCDEELSRGYEVTDLLIIGLTITLLTVILIRR